MEFISNKEGTFRIVDYHDYIASNLSEFGCAIFPEDDYPDFDFEQLIDYLQEQAAYLGQLDKVVLMVADSGDKRIHRYYVVVNGENRVVPFGFFDAVRLASNYFELSRFYAAAFPGDEIFEYTTTQINLYGALPDLARLLNLNSSRRLCVRQPKWCAPPGYVKYLKSPRVFCNVAEQAYYEKYAGSLHQFRVYYSWEECQHHFEPSTNTLYLGHPTALEFAIDNPQLTIDAKVLKARNLNLKTLLAETVYCAQLRCLDFKVNRIYAAGIECQKFTADAVHADFNGGLKINPNLEGKITNQPIRRKNEN